MHALCWSMKYAGNIERGDQIGTRILEPNLIRGPWSVLSWTLCQHSTLLRHKNRPGQQMRSLLTVTAYLINNIYTLVGFSQSLSVFVSESAMTALILNTTFTRDPAWSSLWVSSVLVRPLKWFLDNNYIVCLKSTKTFLIMIMVTGWCFMSCRK